MRYYQIASQKIDEVRMGQSDLDKFINGEEAQGIRIGFEAELCFPSVYADDYDPDWSKDKFINFGIDSIIYFFNHEHWNTPSTLQTLRNTLETDFKEWQEEDLREKWKNDKKEIIADYLVNNAELFNMTYSMTNYLSELGHDTESIDRILNNRRDALHQEAYTHANRELDDMIDKVLDSVGDESEEAEMYRALYNEIYTNFQTEEIKTLTESAWCDARNYNSMSDVWTAFSEEIGLVWPYTLSGNGELNQYSAEILQKSLQSTLGVKVKTGLSYHSIIRRPGLWIIEADSSIEPNSKSHVPAEIISPPMPLIDGLNKLKEFYQWGLSQGAYSNKSTGFHVGVSLPNTNTNPIDYVKLALFLGDEYVLKKFNRANNEYTYSALGKIQKAIAGGHRITDADVKDTLEKMRNNQLKNASELLRVTGGFNKYTSLVVKSGYIEFRSMGGSLYFKEDNLDTILIMIKRYAYAMHIAGNPDLHRKEYAKKLYKLFSTGEANTPEKDAMRIFSMYSAGEMSPDQAARFLRSLQADRARRNRAINMIQQTSATTDSTPPTSTGAGVLPPGNTRYNVYDTNDGVVLGTFIARTDDSNSAEQAFRSFLTRNGLDSGSLLYNYSPVV